MSNQTDSHAFLEELIDYKHEVIKNIAKSQKIVGLLLDDASVDMESDAAYEIVGKNIYDYDYVDKTVQRDDAYIMVEAELSTPRSGTMNRWFLYVQIVCSKRYNQLDAKKFKGVRGNRRDNLALAIDELINGNRNFGIGPVELKNVAPSMVPDTFTSVIMTYTIEDYRYERIKRTEA